MKEMEDLSNFYFKNNSGFETKGTVLSSFTLLHLMLIRRKACTMTNRIEKLLQHRSILHRALFQNVQVENMLVLTADISSCG